MTLINVHIIGSDDRLRRFVDEQGLSLCVFDDEIKALNAAEELKPSIILLNYQIRQNQTAEFIALLIKASVDTKVVLVADELADDAILECLIAGAQGYVEFVDVEKSINKLIKVILAGEAWITRSMTAKVLHRLRA